MWLVHVVHDAMRGVQRPRACPWAEHLPRHHESEQQKARNTVRLPSSDPEDPPDASLQQSLQSLQQRLSVSLNFSVHTLFCTAKPDIPSIISCSSFVTGRRVRHPETPADIDHSLANHTFTRTLAQTEARYSDRSECAYVLITLEYDAHRPKLAVQLHVWLKHLIMICFQAHHTPGPGPTEETLVTVEFLHHQLRPLEDPLEMISPQLPFFFWTCSNMCETRRYRSKQQQKLHCI